MKLLYLVISVVSYGSHAQNSKIAIKIVNEYSKGEDFGTNIDLFLGPQEDGLNELRFDHDTKESKLKINPMPFTGPEQFKNLTGLCFSHLNDKYKFKYCPFYNVSQEEVVATYEPFKGILGVWGEWIIVNNTFTAMHFLGGAKCGSGFDRKVKIMMKCGNFNQLGKMSEPSKCMYEGEFYTPLACGKNALVVYPRLPKSLQKEWDEIETQKHFNIITQKGYDEELKRLFLKAGFYLTDDRKASLSEQVTTDNKCDAVKDMFQDKIKELEKKVEDQEEIIKSLKVVLLRNTDGHLGKEKLNLIIEHIEQGVQR